MKIKDLVSLKGCYSAHDVGELEVLINNNIISAYITDRIAQAMREANPNIGDNSFDRSKYYVDNIMSFLIADARPLKVVTKESAQMEKMK